MNIELSSTSSDPKIATQATQEDDFKSTDAKFSSFKKLKSLLTGVLPVISFQIYISFRLYSFYHDTSALAQLVNGVIAGLTCLFLRYYVSFYSDDSHNISKEKFKNPPRTLALTLSLLGAFFQIMTMSMLHTYMVRVDNYIKAENFDSSEVMDITWPCRSLLFTMIFLIGLYAATLVLSYKDLTLEKSEFVKIQNMICFFLTVCSFGMIYKGVHLNFYNDYPYLSEIVPTWIIDNSIVNGFMSLIITVGIWYVVQRKSPTTKLGMTLFALFATIINIIILMAISDYSSRVRQFFANTASEDWMTPLSIVNSKELAMAGCEKYLPLETCNLDLTVLRWEDALSSSEKNSCLNQKCSPVAGNLFESEYLDLKLYMIGSCFFLLASMMNLVLMGNNDPSKLTAIEKYLLKQNSIRTLTVMALVFVAFSFRQAQFEPKSIEIYPGQVRYLEISNYLASHPILKDSLFKYNQYNQLATYLDQTSYNSLVQFIFDKKLDFLVLTPFLAENNDLILTSTNYDEYTSITDIPMIMDSHPCGISFIWSQEGGSKVVKVIFYASDETPSEIKDTIFSQFSLEGEVGEEPKVKYYYTRDRKSLQELLN